LGSFQLALQEDQLDDEDLYKDPTEGSFLGIHVSYTPLSA
jgi:hypothetical protein